MCALLSQTAPENATTLPRLQAPLHRSPCISALGRMPVPTAAVIRSNAVLIKSNWSVPGFRVQCAGTAPAQWAP
jgi:hypothetical protein